MNALFLALKLLTANPVNVEIVHDAYDLFAECSELSCDDSDSCVPTWTSADPACSAVALVKLVSESHAVATSGYAAGKAAYRAALNVGRSDSAGYYDSFRAADHAHDCPAGPYSDRR